MRYALLSLMLLSAPSMALAQQCSVNQDGKLAFQPCPPGSIIPEASTHVGEVSLGKALSSPSIAFVNKSPLFSVSRQGQVSIDWTRVAEEAQGPMPDVKDKSTLMMWSMARSLQAVRDGQAVSSQPIPE
jgi:hypothetical protein